MQCMRRTVSLTLSSILAVGVLAVPVTTFTAVDPQPITPHRSTVAISGINQVALTALGALDPVDTPLDEIRSDGTLAALTTELETQHFLVTGVTWDASDRTEVTEVAARLHEAGAWSAWTHLPLSDSFDDAEVEGLNFREGTEPLTSTGADGIQVRIRTTDGKVPQGAQIELIDPLVSPADAQITSPGGAVAYASETTDVLKPRVITRKQWGANEKLGSSWNTLSNGVKSIYIHHTAGANSYTRQQAPAIVRGIHSYHTVAMRWPDIGYQFLADKYGNIYQGRRNATVDTPIGAQAGGYNTGTIGVSALGNYQTVRPTPELLKAMTDVVAWKAYEYGIDPVGTTTLVTGQSSKSTTKARSGTRVRVNTILGHRDTNYTACPGIYLYDQLPKMRTDVSDLIGAAQVVAGSPVDVLALPTRVAPTASQAPVQWSRTSTYKWRAVKGAASYQVLTQSSASHKSGRPANSTWLLHANTKKRSIKITVPVGVTRVIGVRAIDASGRRGPIRVLGTVSGPLSRGALAYKKSEWATAKNKLFYGGSALRSRKKGATLRVTGVGATRHVALRVRRAPNAGSVRITLGTWSKNVNLAAKKTNPNAIVRVKLPVAQTGTLTIRTRSAKRVYIAGVGLGRTGRATVAARKIGPATPAVVVGTQANDPLVATQTIQWKARKNAESYLVMTRTAGAADAALGPWQRTEVKSLNYEVQMQPGQYTQVAVLAKRGNSWRGTQQVVEFGRSIDLSSAVINRGWTYVSASPGAGGNETSALVAQTGGAIVNLPRVRSVTGARLVAATGPDQGTVVIRVGTDTVATVNLATYPAAESTVIELPFAATVSTRLQLRTEGTAPVTVHGIALTRE